MVPANDEHGEHFDGEVPTMMKQYQGPIMLA